MERKSQQLFSEPVGRTILQGLLTETFFGLG